MQLIVDMQVVQKVKFPIFYLYRATHEVEIHSHISFTSPDSHLGCLDTYHSDISICHALHRKKVGPGHITIS